MMPNVLNRMRFRTVRAVRLLSFTLPATMACAPLPVYAQTPPPERPQVVDQQAVKRGFDERAAKQTEVDRRRDDRARKAIGSMCSGCGVAR